jgi:polyisoprenoid-binding protein YceI
VTSRGAKTAREPVVGRLDIYCEAMTAPVGHLRIGPGCGHLIVRTRREGLAAKAGHDLTIDVTMWSGDLMHNPNDLPATTLAVTIDLDSLSVREGAGGALPLTDRDRKEINATMRRILGSSASPATFVAIRVIASGDGGAIDGTLTIHGTDRPLRLAVVHGDAHRYRGTATVTQSAFGIKPYSGMFGTLKVRDEVQIEFDVDLDAAERVRS